MLYGVLMAISLLVTLAVAILVKDQVVTLIMFGLSMVFTHLIVWVRKKVKSSNRRNS